MNTQYQSRESTAQYRIDRIEQAIAEIRSQLEQDKNDILKLNWAQIGDLGRVAQELDQIARQYTQ